MASSFSSCAFHYSSCIFVLYIAVLAAELISGLPHPQNEPPVMKRSPQSDNPYAGPPPCCHTECCCSTCAPAECLALPTPWREGQDQLVPMMAGGRAIPGGLLTPPSSAVQPLQCACESTVAYTCQNNRRAVPWAAQRAMPPALPYYVQPPLPSIPLGPAISPNLPNCGCELPPARGYCGNLPPPSLLVPPCPTVCPTLDSYYSGCAGYGWDYGGGGGDPISAFVRGLFSSPWGTVLVIAVVVAVLLALLATVALCFICLCARRRKGDGAGSGRSQTASRGRQQVEPVSYTHIREKSAQPSARQEVDANAGRVGTHTGRDGNRIPRY